MNQDKFDFTAIENLDLKYKGELPTKIVSS